MSVVTRFAPSPTGALHIGGARTALFNLLYAKRHGGRYLLRVEDTDRKRSTQEAIDAIYDGLGWLGLMSDEDPVMQFARSPRHVDCAEQMLASGAAFKCYVTPDELQARRDAGEARRKEAKAEGLTDAQRAALRVEADGLLAPFRSPYRDGAPPPSPDAPFTVRLRAPDDGAVAIRDEVQGDVRINASEIDDLILVRADGTPTYMLAVVVDDHDMGVTHIVRGDDHLRNAFRQTPIYNALGWTPPVWAHVPLIHGADGAKLSKRHGATGVNAYRDLGYLPEALVNYLMRLGWSHGDREYFTIEEAAAVFDLSAINKSPARLDLAKLDDMNGHYMAAADPDRLAGLTLGVLEQSVSLSPEYRSRISKAMPVLRERAATIPQLAEACAFLIASRPLALNKKARKAVNAEGLDRLRAVSDHLQKTAPWDAETLEGALASFCAGADLSMGQIGPPLRAALTGGSPAPQMGLVMDWLGSEETIGRIDDVLTKDGAAA